MPINAQILSGGLPPPTAFPRIYTHIYMQEDVSCCLGLRKNANVGLQSIDDHVHPVTPFFAHI